MCGWRTGLQPPSDARHATVSEHVCHMGEGVCSVARSVADTLLVAEKAA